MESIPFYLSATFVFTTLLTVILLRRALIAGEVPTKKVWMVFGILLLWLIVQDVVASSGFYLEFDVMPPRFLLAIVPPLVSIIALMSIKSSREAILKLPLFFLTAISMVRIPVELCLYWLHQQGKVPQLMTFEGRNFDILSGLSALVIMYLIHQNKINNRTLLVWNLVCLGLLFNIVINAILAAPLPFQQQAFDQPNVAVFYFPFIWLPSLIVPAVLFAHVAAITQLLRKN